MMNSGHPEERLDAATDHEADDQTLGGYFSEHNRPPAFGGPDGEPYTVSPEADLVPSLEGRYEGYLVFLRWAATGAGVLDHVETGTLVTGESSDAVLEALGRMPLSEIKRLLDGAVRRNREGGVDPSGE